MDARERTAVTVHTSLETVATAAEGLGARQCRLQGALNRFERCRSAGCPFWEDGGAVVEAGCLLQRLQLDLEGEPGLACGLLHVRAKLEQALTARDRSEAHALLVRLVPTIVDELE